jgi:hypothetical protein
MRKHGSAYTCETHMRELSSGDELVGLERAFVCAGSFFNANNSTSTSYMYIEKCPGLDSNQHA